MKILITGGAGFMGSHMVRWALQNIPDAHVVNFDKLTYAGNPENLIDVHSHPNYRFVHGDICDPDEVDRVLSDGIDVVLNYAAETHVDRSIMDPSAFLRTDVIGTYTLLEAIKKYPVKKYIQISTDEVFGSIEEGESDEDANFQPNSPYAAAKAGGDLLCRSYVKTFHLPVIVSHSTNVFGPQQYPEKMIPLFITNLIESKKVPLYGDGLNHREWVYVDDHCRAIQVLIEQGEVGEIYNIGSGWRMSNKELVDVVLETLWMADSMVEYVKDRPGHDRRYALNSSKIRELGWKPESTFRARLEETISWYKDNEAWWKKIKSGEYLEYYKKQYGK